MKTTVALVQMDIALGEPEINRRRGETLIREAVRGGAKVVVLPEMWTTAYSMADIHQLADSDGEPTGQMLAQLARELSIYIVGGSIADILGGKVFNRSRVFDPEGQVIADYSKIHLFRLMEEDRYLAAGNRPSSFRLGDITAGQMICYDLRFPELARTLALSGAEVLFVPAEWPLPRLSHWRALNIARAIENQCYVVACNRVGTKHDPAGDTHFFGHSLIVDPWGEVLVEGDDKESILFGELDSSLVSEVRGRIPVFRDRKPDVYNLTRK